MTDDLAKYEALASQYGTTPGELRIAIRELVAMVREAVGNTEHALHQMKQQKERAEAAGRERDEWKQHAEDLNNDYLRRHKDACEARMELADWKDAARSEADRVNELTAEIAELKRKMREPDESRVDFLGRDG